MIFIFILLCIIHLNYSFYIPKFYKTRTFIHIEKFNPRFNLFHIGVSFTQGNRYARFDFRESKSEISFMKYSNNPLSVLSLHLFKKSLLKISEDNYYPNEYLPFNFENDLYESVNIFWGISNKSLDEIIEYEKSINKNYILGFNDCRHYSRKLTKWTTNYPTPIWKLKNLYSKYI